MGVDMICFKKRGHDKGAWIRLADMLRTQNFVGKIIV